MEENTNKKNKLKKLKGALSSAAMIMMLNSCDVPETNVNTVDSTSTTTVESTSEITTEELTTETPITEVATEEPTTEYEVETIEYDCPIEYNGEMLGEFNQYMLDNYGGCPEDFFYNTGYDNPILRQALIDFVEEKTGNYDESVAIDNFKYFQFGGSASQDLLLGFPYESLMEQTEKGIDAEEFYIARAALIENDLRYMIDEIPYSYFEERFPEIMDNYSSMEYRRNLLDKYFDIDENYHFYENIVQVSDLSDEEKDIVIFCSLMNYNNYRTPYLYKHNIPQVRDINTNKIQLNPVKSQLDQINKGVSKIPGFIDNVMEVETRENYYECYGEYPEDVIGETNSMTKGK